jgi:hypothetical protein
MGSLVPQDEALKTKRRDFEASMEEFRDVLHEAETKKTRALEREAVDTKLASNLAQDVATSQAELKTLQDGITADQKELSKITRFSQYFEHFVVASAAAQGGSFGPNGAGAAGTTSIGDNPSADSGNKASGGTAAEFPGTFPGGPPEVLQRYEQLTASNVDLFEQVRAWVCLSCPSLPPCTSVCIALCVTTTHPPTT